MAGPVEVETAIYPSLRGKVVFITGGGSGIGASIVEHFCAQRCEVAFVDIAVAEATSLVDRIAARGLPRPLFVQCDLRDIAALQAAIDRVGRELGTIRVLVNNAGNDDRHHFAKVTPDYWDDRVAVNLRHQFFAAQAVHAGMKAAGGGSIINFGSISWMNAEGGYAAYTASKAAVHGLTRSLARDFGPDNIRANTVVPGWIMTERQIKLWLDESGERQIQENQCLKEKLYPPDIARMVLFLAADDSRLCTAQNFVVDAGWT
ncbi:MAG: SDR family oxidoreductase [Alphaproteobacteria bacterium]|nr:SDR family oxidoreductase [Alphaproteobacteria bacterium]